jgi:hypothetical protein
MTELGDPMPLLAADYPLLEIFLSIFYFFIFFVWILLIFNVFVDIFRSSDLSGFAKTVWVIVVIVFWILGPLIYLIVRGGKMHERAAAAAAAQDKAMRQYIQQAAGSTSTADELAKLSALRDAGSITPEEFEAGKAKILG